MTPDPETEAPLLKRWKTYEDLPDDTGAKLHRYAARTAYPPEVILELFLREANRRQVVQDAARLPPESRAWDADAKGNFVRRARIGQAWNRLHETFPDAKAPFVRSELEFSGTLVDAAREAESPWSGREGWGDEPALPIIYVRRKGNSEDEVPAEEGYVLYNELVTDHHLRPFRTYAGGARVAMPLGGGLETFNPTDRDGEFVKRLGYELFTRIGKPVPGRDLNIAAEALRGRALSRDLPKSRVVRLSLRVAEFDGCSRVDLLDDARRCVKVTAEGWSIESVTHPVFDRRSHMLSLPEPEVAADPQGWRRFEEFWKFTTIPPRVGTDDPRLLVQAFLVHFVLSPRTPKPVGVVNGEEGAGKSSTSKRIQALVDPSVSPLVGTSQLEDPKELINLVINHAVLNVDNVSVISHELSDDLARLSTGVGFAKRELFTDSGEIVGDVCPLILLNGITATPRAADLLRRVVFFPVLPPEVAVGLHQMETEWPIAHPRILGGLFDLAAATARVLRDDPPRPIASSMADHVRIGQAVAVAMGRSGDDFLSAWKVNVERQGNAAAEDPWVSALGDFFGLRRPDSEAVDAQGIARWITDNGKAYFPKGVTAQAVGLALARAKRTLCRMDIWVSKRVVHGRTLYYRALPDVQTAKSPALDDFADPLISPGPTTPEQPHQSHLSHPGPPFSDVGELGGTRKTESHPGTEAQPLQGGTQNESHPSPTPSPTPLPTSQNTIRGGTGDTVSSKERVDELSSAIAGPRTTIVGQEIPEETFEGETRADRARRAWSEAHPDPQ